EETVKLRKARLGADHPDTLASMNNLGEAYRKARKLDLALPLFQEAAAGTEKRSFSDKLAGTYVYNLCDCCERLRQFDQAEAWLRKWLPVVKGRSGADSLAYAGALASLGRNLLLQKKWGDAEPLLRESLAVRQKKEPDDWRTFNAKAMLGGTFLGQGRYVEAEPLLLEGYEGMKARAAKIPVESQERPTEAIERLVALYEANANRGAAAKWRRELQAQRRGAPRPKAGPAPEPMSNKEGGRL